MMTFVTITLREARDIKTAPLVATGLIGGRLTTRETGICSLGDVTLGVAGTYATRTWNVKIGILGAAGLIVAYLGVFGLSHPLAKKAGVWLPVPIVTTLVISTVATADSR